MGSEKQQMGKNLAWPDGSAKKSWSNEAKFKRTVADDMTRENILDVSCCQRGREEPRIFDAEPWGQGVRNEHEMLNFHLHRF